MVDLGGRRDPEWIFLIFDFFLFSWIKTPVGLSGWVWGGGKGDVVLTSLPRVVYHRGGWLGDFCRIHETCLAVWIESTWRLNPPIVYYWLLEPCVPLHNYDSIRPKHLTIQCRSFFQQKNLEAAHRTEFPGHHPEPSRGYQPHIIPSRLGFAIHIWRSIWRVQARRDLRCTEDLDR